MNPLIAQLPPVRGRLTADAAIGKQTWFGVGGPAEVLFRPADVADLAGFLAALPPRVPTTVIGVASNLLVRDGGIPGVVIRLGRGSRVSRSSAMKSASELALSTVSSP